MTPTSDTSTGGAHRVEWSIDDYGVTATFICTAPGGAECRMICARGCDNGCFADDDGPPHERIPIDYCNACEWLNEPCPWEVYAGKGTTIRDGAVVPTWDTGGYYRWDYEQEKAS